MKQESTIIRHSLWELFLGFFLIAQTACMNNPSQLGGDGEKDMFFQAHGGRNEMLGSGRQENIIEKYFFAHYLVGRTITRETKKEIIKWLKEKLSSEKKNEIAKRILEDKDEKTTFRALKEKLGGNTKSISQIIADIDNTEKEEAFTQLNSLLVVLSKKDLCYEDIKYILVLIEKIAGASLELREKAHKLVTTCHYHNSDDKTWAKLMKCCKSILGLSKEEKQHINKKITFGKGPF